MSAPTSAGPSRTTSMGSDLSKRTRDVDAMRQQLHVAMENERRMSPSRSRTGSPATIVPPPVPSFQTPYAGYPPFFASGGFPWMPPMFPNDPGRMTPQGMVGGQGFLPFPASQPVMPSMPAPVQGGWQEYYRRIGLVPSEGFPQMEQIGRVHQGVNEVQLNALQQEVHPPTRQEEAPAKPAPPKVTEPAKTTKSQPPAKASPAPENEKGMKQVEIPVEKPAPPKARARRATWSSTSTPDPPPAWNSSTAVEKKRIPSLASPNKPTARQRTASDTGAIKQSSAASGQQSAASTAQSNTTAAPIGMMAAPSTDGGTPVMFSIPPNTTMTISFAPVPAPADPAQSPKTKRPK